MFFQNPVKSFFNIHSCKNSAILNQPLISIVPDINLSVFPINLFFKNAVCYEEINVGKTVFYGLK